MTSIGFHASHEQRAPSRLLRDVVRAQQVGFDEVMCSDHMAPWLTAQGESGFAWSWLGAALATTTVPIGVVTAPGQRYHPTVLAQAAATLEEMFPGRFWAALGSGEALNEHVTGVPWPSKQERDARLLACATVMRRLLSGQRVSVDGPVRVHDARLWSLPATPPPLRAAAISPHTATLVAPWADGLITVGADPASTRETREAFRDAGGRGPLLLQIHLSLEDSDEGALASAHEQWAQATVPPELMWELEQPEDFEEFARPTEDRLRQSIVIGSNAGEVAGRIAAAASGFDAVFLHQVGPDQSAFLDRCEAELLPALRRML
ncbi:coenzyme F420-dependent glucose-6-phosphate dehydrogenase [Microbacterium sp. W4I4]|uniref:TIGR03885 family FMN-dependent LLM class oxidoreductase n=1 Tax=Microbacterium sp. W4I4 TaxID=3042295 RepID=UPI00278A4FB3|nr:TIGR03885 family FMN-dependent LLM class oxidoreductase [Microbacterium sp. W4I4]MDQ0615431.1 coenzyme F420-dependent glucose-6-phosphate dehydrogenase [Microbacterium sp. W4I4]